jgi:AcrR family transcriptional regulator
MPPRLQPPLTPHDWIRAAFRALASDGVSAIKAEVLAKQLSATKGSFYWHFKDVPSFHRDMLELWESEATRGIMDQVRDSATDGPARLVLLSHIVATMNANNDYGGLSAEPSIRDWARYNTAAAAALRRVDETRIGFVTGLFQDSGFAEPDARHRAEIFYAGFVGLQGIAAFSEIDVAARLEKLLGLLMQGAPMQVLAKDPEQKGTR